MAEEPEVPEEIQDYYETERRERTGVAWLLAFGTLIATILVASGIFFAGRWAYREIAGTDDDGSTEIAQNEEQEQSETERQEEQEPSGGQGNAEDESDASDTPQNGGAVQGNNDIATPATGDSSGDLPGTGPSGTATAFFAVSIISYLVHRFYMRRTQE